jgi:hypothetical protein
MSFPLPACASRGTHARERPHSVPTEARLAMRPFTPRRRIHTLRCDPTAVSTLPAYTSKRSSDHLPPSSPPLPCLRVAGESSPTHDPCSGLGGQIRSEDSPSLRKLRSPLGPLDPAGSLRIAYVRPKKLACANRPIFRHSPRRQFVAIPITTDHHSRSATSRQTCCSFSFLEPPPSCACRGTASTGIGAFPQRDLHLESTC